MREKRQEFDNVKNEYNTLFDKDLTNKKLIKKVSNCDFTIFFNKDYLLLKKR